MNRTTTRKLLASYLEDPAARLLSKLGIAPNVLTLLGLVIAGASAYLLGSGQLAAGGVVLLLSGVFDTLDGAVARATGRTTRFGALLDSVVDRVSESVILLGLLIFFLRSPSSLSANWGAVLVLVALAGSLMVSYVRAKAEGLGIECKVGVLTRTERVVVLAAALIVGQWWPPAVRVALGVIGALAAVTTVQRVLHVRRALAKAESSASEFRDTHAGDAPKRTP